MADERRKHPRVKLLPADLRVMNAKPYEVVTIIDVSLGGMKIEITGEIPKVSALIDVTLSSGTREVLVNATVRHLTPLDGGRHLVGVEFDDPDLIEAIAGDLIGRAH